MAQDMEGTPVSEEEVAADLGCSVEDLKFYATERGRKMLDLQTELMHAKNDRDNFRWSLGRMMALLEKIKPTLTDRKLLLAIEVVMGRGVDWDHELDDWWYGERKSEKET